MMPANKRPRRLNYAVNKKWPKSWTKLGKAIAHYKRLENRLKIEWETKWLKNAMDVVLVKFKKYSVNINKI